MANTKVKVTFGLDIPAAGQEVLQRMAMPAVQQAGRNILSRANSMASSQSTNAPVFELSSQVGVIKRGQRAIARVSASTNNARQAYLARTALAKARDAGRLN